MTCEELRLEFQMLLDSGGIAATEQMHEHTRTCLACATYLQEHRLLHTQLQQLEYEPVPEILQNKIRNIAAVHHAKQKNIFLEILADLGFLAAAGLVRVLYAHPSPVNFLIATVLVTGLLAFFLIEFLQPYFFSYND